MSSDICFALEMNDHREPLPTYVLVDNVMCVSLSFFLSVSCLVGERADRFDRSLAGGISKNLTQDAPRESPHHAPLYNAVSPVLADSAKSIAVSHI